MRHFDVLPNFAFTTSETMSYYYLQTWHIGVASGVAERLKTWNLRILGNTRKLLAGFPCQIETNKSLELNHQLNKQKLTSHHQPTKW